MSSVTDIVFLVLGLVVEIFLIYFMNAMSRSTTYLKSVVVLSIPVVSALPVILIKLKIVEYTLLSVFFAIVYFIVMLFGYGKKDSD